MLKTDLRLFRINDMRTIKILKERKEQEIKHEKGTTIYRKN